MNTHHLSRGARLALTLFLSAAVILPIALLIPRYLDWQDSIAQKDAAAYSASVEATLNR